MTEVRVAKQAVLNAGDREGEFKMVAPLPRVAVLLAAYNGMKYIGDQVESILSQKGVDVTVFFSVDRSTDGTEKWVAGLSQQTSRAVLLPYGERFGGAASNFFRLVRDVDFSGFDYIALADQDDIWLDDKLRRAHDLMLQNQYDAYSANVLAFWPEGREMVINKAQPQVSHDYLFEAAGPGCTYVFTVASALRLKAFMQQHWVQVNSLSLHDWFFYAWYRASGLLWFIDIEWRMRYRQHANNQVGANQGFSAMCHRLKLLRSGWYRAEVARISVLVSPSGDQLANLVRKKSSWANLRLLPSICVLRRRLKDRVFLFFMIILGIY